VPPIASARSLRPSKPEPDAASAPPSAGLACAADLRLRPAGQSAFTRARGSQGRKMKKSPTASCDLFMAEQAYAPGNHDQHRVPERVQTRPEARTFEG